MKRLVRGRSGALVVYNRVSIGDEDLKREADQIGERRTGGVLSALENDFSSYSVIRVAEDDRETGDARVDDADSLGLDVARSYGVSYERLALPEGEGIAIYEIAGRTMKVRLDDSRQERRESLTSNLRRMSFRPKE